MENEYPYSQNRSQSNLVFALAREVQQYLEANTDKFDGDTWDNIQYWRSGILSQGVITEDNLSEIMNYIGAEKLQELIAIASSNK